MLNWNDLVFGTFSPNQVKWAVSDPWWQDVRITMLGVPLEGKYNLLVQHLQVQRYSPRAKIQVTNYVNALKRGGLI